MSRHFFPNNVLSAMVSGGRSDGGSAPGDAMANEGQFRDILQMFAVSFSGRDIAVFKANLASLQLVNERCRLYSKAMFRTEMRFHFLRVFFEVMLAKSHQLLNDDICTAVYSMASTDFESYFGVFLPQFLESCADLSPEQKAKVGSGVKTDTDLPTFMRSLGQFIKDIAYFRTRNEALSSVGTVVFG